MVAPISHPQTTLAVRQVMLTLLAKDVKLIAIAPPRTRASPTFAADLCREYAASGMTVVHLQLDGRHGLAPARNGAAADNNGAAADNNGTAASNNGTAASNNGTAASNNGAAADNNGTNGGSDADGPVIEWWPTKEPQVERWRTPNQGVIWRRAPTNVMLQQTFNRPEALRQALGQAFATAQAVILELAPVLSLDVDVVSPLAAAASCDGVILLCPLDVVTREDVRTAQARLTAAGAKVIGTVLDETLGVPPLVEMAQSLGGWSWIAPKRIARVQDWLRQSSSSLRN